MLIGLDFDNTIVCYDGLFHRLACERALIPGCVGDLLSDRGYPARPSTSGQDARGPQDVNGTTVSGSVSWGVAATKQAVRDFLRAAGREAEWTELQGIAYGPRITDAEPFPGVMEFLGRCRTAGVDVVVVSHKTRHPYRGEKHDLHAAAHAFLESHGFYASDTGLSPDRVFLELTLADKLRRVGSLGCAAFVDDLPEVLGEPAFPPGVRKVLFDPASAHLEQPGITRVTSWAGCADVLVPQEVCA